MVKLKELFEEEFKKCNRICHPRGNKAGFYRVHKNKKNNYWQYHRTINGKLTHIHEETLLDLKEKVLSEGLPWEISDMEVARATVEKEGLDWELFKNDDVL